MDDDIIEYLKKEEKRLCEKYQVTSIQEVLEIQDSFSQNDDIQDICPKNVTKR